jgi:hypothetical protein
MDTVTHVRITGPESAPAPFKPGWIPIEGPADLQALREEHLRLMDVGAAEFAKLHDINERIERSKKDREAALRDAYLNGTAPEDVEDNSEKLKAERAVATERATGAHQALVEHVNRVIAFVLENSPEWVADIAEKEAAVHADIAELERQLRSAHARRGEHFKFMHWIERTQAGADTPMLLFPYDEIPVPPSDHAERAASQQRAMEAAYAGGMPGMRKISDEEAIQREKDFQVPLDVSDAERQRAEASLDPQNGGQS